MILYPNQARPLSSLLCLSVKLKSTIDKLLYKEKKKYFKFKSKVRGAMWRLHVADSVSAKKQQKNIKVRQLRPLKQQKKEHTTTP